MVHSRSFIWSVAISAIVAGMMFSATSMRAQQVQTPSPMVEHTRPHPRLPEVAPEGQRETLELGTWFVPKGVKKKAPLFIHFHGAPIIP